MERIELTDNGRIPAGTDVDTVIASPFECDLIAVRNTFNEIRYTRQTLAVIDADKTKANVAAHMREELAKLADVTALQALAADQRLVELLTGRRWSTMQDAREAGESWAAIGAALGMSKQAAVDWYRRKIADQEKYAPNFHDSERARAALNEGE